MKKIVQALTGLAGSGVLALALVALPNLAAAEAELLAKVELNDVQQAELWGNKLKGGYARELQLLLKDKDGKVVAAYNPDIKGGYNAQLQAVQVKPINIAEAGKEQKKSDQMAKQILLSVAQGDWRQPTEYRIYDFANPKRVVELFDAADSMGIVLAASEEYENNETRLKLRLINNEESTAVLSDLGEYKYQPKYGGLYSLTAHDWDEDGQDELFSAQQVVDNRQVVADVGAIWELKQAPELAEAPITVLGEEAGETEKSVAASWQKPQWQHSAFTIMTVVPSDRSNTINDGLDFDGGTILSKRMVLPGSEATYPVFIGQDLDLVAKVNDVLQKENAKYLDGFYRLKADTAFKVTRADADVLSIQLISSDKAGLDHHNVNIDLENGKLLKISDVLDVDNKELLPLLEVLKTSEAIDYEGVIPEEWYLEGNNLYLMKKVDGHDEVQGYALGNLHKYVKFQKLITKS